MTKTRNPYNIVLLNPEIPQNTGNIGRTCVALGARLHLVGELGFSLDSTRLKRAGLDYWDKLDLVCHNNWDEFQKTLDVNDDICFFSTHGHIPLWKRKFKTPFYLVFGSESRGLPKALYKSHDKELIRIPIGPDVRSLNLATAVGVAVFEAVRQLTIQLSNQTEVL